MTARTPTHIRGVVIAFALTVFLLLSCRESPPNIEKIKPVFGLMHGGETVAISGHDIEAMMPVAVYFGNDRVVLTQLQSRNELWVTTPVHDLEEVVDIRIIGNDGTEFLMEKAFEYVKKAEMAECVNVSKQLNGTPVLERSSKRSPSK